MKTALLILFLTSNALAEGTMPSASPSPSPSKTPQVKYTPPVCPHTSPLQVGVDKAFKSIMSAVNHSCDGDTIEVDAGLYVNDNLCVRVPNLTIKGVNGRPHMHAQALPGKTIPPTFPGTFEGKNYGFSCSNKGIIVQQAPNLTIDNMEVSGAKDWNYNGAGIRQEASGLTVIRSLFHDNEDGILGSSKGPGTWAKISYSEFHHNGAGDGQSHGVYFGPVDSLTVEGSSFHNNKIGHNFKSRARHFLIRHNKFYDGDNGTASYQLDISGGNGEVSDNYIQKGLKAANKGKAIYFYTDKNPDGEIDATSNKHSLKFYRNVCVSFLFYKGHFVGETNLGVYAPSPSVVIDSQNNVFLGLKPRSPTDQYTYIYAPIAVSLTATTLTQSGDKIVKQGDPGWDQYLQPMPEGS